MRRLSATLPTQIPAGTPPPRPPRRLPSPTNRDIKALVGFLGVQRFVVRSASSCTGATPWVRRLGRNALGTGAEVGGGRVGRGGRELRSGTPSSCAQREALRIRRVGDGALLTPAPRPTRPSA